MIELRFLRRNTGERIINKHGMFTDGEETVLQYRQKIDTTVRAGQWSTMKIIETANYQWTDWIDVKTIDQFIKSEGVPDV